MMHFFVGLHQPSDAGKVPAAFISVLRLWKRKSGFTANDWIMDSGAFSIIAKHGRYPDEMSPAAYAGRIRKFAGCGTLHAAVAQDYMCEAHMLEKTGLTIDDHQRLTIERYDALAVEDTGGVYIMPVLQGYAPADYVRHTRMYGDRLKPGMWVGVGSVCKRNGDPASIEAVLIAIKRERPDLKLHGFGIKTTAFSSAVIRGLLFTADSMAWSFAARKQGRDGNDYREALVFAERIRLLEPRRDLFTFGILEELCA